MMLVFDHVCVFYGDTPVLRELSFQIRSGEQVGLIGANGAGKSTLMKAALGLLPYTGSITVDGIPVTRKTLPEVRRKLGYVLQDADNQMFMPTVLDDMVFGPMNYGLSRAAAEQRAEETLAELHMEYLRDRHNHKMSGGEKRMAAVATILAMQPQMLLMDEPSMGLSPLLVKEIFAMIQELHESGITILLTRPFEDGDFVEAGDVSGTVKDIGLIYTQLCTLDNKDIYVPNSDLSASKIVNYSREPQRRVDLTFGADYTCRPEQVKAALHNAVSLVSGILPEPAPFVRVSGYGESNIEYTVRVWCKTADYWTVYYDLMEAVGAAFDAHGVSMSYPQMNVHVLDTPESAKRD